MSLVNLIRLTDQLCFLEGAECKKQFTHSKAIAILMMRPEEGGCHACGGLTSQTLLYSLSCIGLVPICISRWGELAATDTASFLEYHYKLQYSEGRSEQFLSCCLASSPGLNLEQIENRVCKWARWKKTQITTIETIQQKKRSSVPFCDGIWPGQSLYQPVADQLKVVTKTNSKLINPPATDWPHSRGKRSAGDPGYWDQVTRSSKKRVLGCNRRKKKGRVEKIIKISAGQAILLLLAPLEIVFQSHCPLLYLSINNLLGAVLNENRPVPNRGIRVDRLKKNKGHALSVVDAHNITHTFVHPTIKYSCANDCKVDGSLQYCRLSKPDLLSKYVCSIVFTDQGRNQIRDRETSGGSVYYLLHDNNKRTKSRRKVIAVVKEVSREHILLAHNNENYGTEKMDFSVIKKSFK